MKINPTVAITGANGFLGGQLINHFTSKGWQVIALVRNPKKTAPKGVRFVGYDLKKSVDSDALRGVDFLVHAAYVKADSDNPNAMDDNIQGAKNILEASRKAGVKKTVFISSMSAHDGAISVYGRQKLQIEKLFNTKNDVSLRPGLIIGNGGIVRNMAQFMKTKHLVPLVAGGNQPLQTIYVGDLSIAIEHALVKNVHGVLTVAHPQVHTYKHFYKRLADVLGVRAAFVPVPYPVMMSVLKILDTLHLNIGIGADNLRGLKKLRSVDTRSDLKKLDLTPSTLDESLDNIRGVL